MQYSLYKTFARKYSTTARKIIAKYRHHKDFAVFYEDKKGGKKMRVFFNGSFKRKTTAMDASCDYVGKHGKIDPVGTDEIDPVKTA